MADISKITTLDGTEYNIKDATARSLISNLPANNLQNLVDGSSTGSVRGIYTSAENNDYTIGNYAFTEGLNTKASGVDSHAEGTTTTASGSHSHAEGRGTIASAETAHAEGTLTTASEDSSHAEGTGTTASGSSAHAEGGYTTASGSNSHAEGSSTIANHAAQHVFGKYNIADDAVGSSSQIGNYIEIVGNGTSNNARSNARTLDWNGNEWLAGTLTAGIAEEGDGSDNHLVSVAVSTDIDISSVPSGNQWYRVFSVKDSNDDVRVYFGAVDTTTGGQGAQMETKRLVNGELVYNGLQLRIKADGTRNVAVSDPVIWRTALGLGTNGAPSFRALVAADIPNLNTSKLTAGTLAVARGGTGVATATKNQVFAAPNGSNGAPGFRALVANDIPELAAGKITSGTFAAARIPTLAQSKISGLEDALDGKLSLSGGTMTAGITHNYNGNQQKQVFTDSWVTGKSVPSSNTSRNGYVVQDKDGKELYYSYLTRTTADIQYKSFVVRKWTDADTSVTNGFYMRIDKNGNSSVTFAGGGKAAWQEALDLTTTTINITKPTSTPTGISTQGTYYCYQYGNVVSFHWESLLTSASPATAWTQLASGFPPPPKNIYFECNCQNATAGNRMRFRILTTGILQYAYGTANATHAGSMTYLIS